MLLEGLIHKGLSVVLVADEPFLLREKRYRLTGTKIFLLLLGLCT